MAQQTAMKKLYTYIHVAHDLGAKEVHAATIMKLINELIELEKEQIMRANVDGYNEAEKHGETSAEEYYNEKYTK